MTQDLRELAEWLRPVGVTQERGLTRMRASVSYEVSRISSRIQKVLEDANVKLASVATSRTCRTGGSSGPLTALHVTSPLSCVGGVPTLPNCFPGIIFVRSQKQVDRRFAPLRFSKSCLQPTLCIARGIDCRDDTPTG